MGGAEPADCSRFSRIWTRAAATSFMSAEVLAFVDSNVLIYAVSQDDAKKQERACEIVARASPKGALPSVPR